MGPFTFGIVNFFAIVLPGILLLFEFYLFAFSFYFIFGNGQFPDQFKSILENGFLLTMGVLIFSYLFGTFFRLIAPVWLDSLSMKLRKFIGLRELKKYGYSHRSKIETFPYPEFIRGEFKKIRFLANIEKLEKSFEQAMENDVSPLIAFGYWKIDIQKSSTGLSNVILSSEALVRFLNASFYVISIGFLGMLFLTIISAIFDLFSIFCLFCVLCFLIISFIIAYFFNRVRTREVLQVILSMASLQQEKGLDN